jgi:hypothetical protein
MRVRSAILSALCSVPVLTTTGCLGALCKPDEKPFAIDRPVTVADVDAIMKRDRPPEKQGIEPERARGLIATRGSGTYSRAVHAPLAFAPVQRTLTWLPGIRGWYGRS